MKKTFLKILALLGALAAIAALLYVFRDKIKDLLNRCGCQKAACDLEDLEGSVEAAVESAEEKAEEVFTEVKETAEDAAAKAKAVIEEFKDYADVTPDEEPAE